MPKPPPPQTIGMNPLDLLVPSAPAAALAGSPAPRRVAARRETTVLTVTVPADLADRLEQLILVMPGLDLDTLASEALESVWATLQRTLGGPPRSAAAAKGGTRKGTRKGTAPGATSAAATPAAARKSQRRKGRDADAHGRKVVVILGE